MSKKNFDIYDYVHNNKFELKVENTKETNVFKGYNDIRKTNMWITMVIQIKVMII